MRDHVTPTDERLARTAALGGAEPRLTSPFAS